MSDSPWNKHQWAFESGDQLEAPLLTLQNNLFNFCFIYRWPRLEFQVKKSTDTSQRMAKCWVTSSTYFRLLYYCFVLSERKTRAIQHMEWFEKRWIALWFSECSLGYVSGALAQNWLFYLWCMKINFVVLSDEVTLSWWKEINEIRYFSFFNASKKSNLPKFGENIRHHDFKLLLFNLQHFKFVLNSYCSSRVLAIGIVQKNENTNRRVHRVNTSRWSYAYTFRASFSNIVKIVNIFNLNLLAFLQPLKLI